MPENRRFYRLRENEIVQEDLHLFRPPANVRPHNYYFMEGVQDDMVIVDLTARQMGVLLSFQPVSSSYIYDSVILSNVRKSFLYIIKKLNSNLSMEEKDQFSNLLQVNMYLHRQSGQNLSLRKVRERSSHFMDLIVNNQHRLIRVGDFFKKRLVVQQRLLEEGIQFVSGKVQRFN